LKKGTPISWKCTSDQRPSHEVRRTACRS